MPRTYDVAVLVGSLRKGSFNRILAAELARLAPAPLRLRIVEMADLAIYDADLESAPPPGWRVFRDEIRAADALLFVTPEYNRSIPGVLKNAIDVGSRPYGQSVWGQKPAAIVSTSVGAVGGFGANHHLRQTLVFLNVFAMQQPEIYLTGLDRMFGPDARIASKDTEAFLASAMSGFHAWIERLTTDR